MCFDTVLCYLHGVTFKNINQRWAKRNQKRKAQLPQPPQLRKLLCALIFYFETLRKLRCGIKRLKFVAL